MSKANERFKRLMIRLRDETAKGYYLKKDNHGRPDCKNCSLAEVIQDIVGGENAGEKSYRMNKPTWSMYEPTDVTDFVQVVPDNDIIDHTSKVTCKCEPSTEWNGGALLVIHHAFDGREETESHDN